MFRKGKEIILWLARRKVSGSILGFLFERWASVLPLRKRAENDFALCLYHPVLVAPNHLLAIPKKRLATIFDLFDDHNASYTEGLFQCVEQALANVQVRFKVVSNFGARQEVKQVHFHVLPAGTDAAVVETVPIGLKLKREWKELPAGRQELRGYWGAGSNNFGFHKNQLLELIKTMLSVEQTALKNAQGFSMIVEVKRDVCGVLQWANGVTFVLDLRTVPPPAARPIRGRKG